MKLRLNGDHPGVHVDYNVRSPLKLGETDATKISNAKVRQIKFTKTEPTEVSADEADRLKNEIRDTVLVEVKDDEPKPAEKQQSEEKHPEKKHK